MPDSISGPFALLLAAQRDRFNSKFNAARRYNPRLDPAAFAEHLRTGMAPIVEAVHAIAPAQTAIVGEALYDLSLDLVSQEFLGPNSRYPHLVEGWRVLLPHLARFIAAEPRQIAGSVTNALHTLSTTPGARPAEWAASLTDLAEVCHDGATLLKAGQVAAWRAGMAHYRLNALGVCEALEPAVGRVALGLAASINDLGPVLGRLRDDPWLRPGQAIENHSASRELKIVARVGAFQGFGGLFLEPPTVSCVHDKFYVTDGHGEWLLSADAFGATFNRVEGIQPDGTALGALFKVESSGQVVHGALSQSFREFENVLSWAANRHTLAVTSQYSHAVYLVALA